MTAQTVLVIEVLPSDYISMEVCQAPGDGVGPVRVPRCDLLYAMLCSAGARLTIPCRVMNKEEPCKK